VDSYPRVRQIWNGAVDQQPAVFALCETVKDVQTAVRAARVHNLPLPARGGGHDRAGRALRDGGLVIDLSGMRDVEVDISTVSARRSPRCRGLRHASRGISWSRSLQPGSQAREPKAPSTGSRCAIFRRLLPRTRCRAVRLFSRDDNSVISKRGVGNGMQG
jgi:hypothetical protein